MRERRRRKKSININTPSAVISKTDPISTSCNRPASTRITAALMHPTACTGVHASGRRYIRAVTNVVQTSLRMTTSPADAVTAVLKATAGFQQRRCFNINIKKVNNIQDPTFTLWSSQSCDKKINSNMARDWGPALGQVSLQSSEQRQLLILLSHVCMAAPWCPHRVGH